MVYIPFLVATLYNFKIFITVGQYFKLHFYKWIVVLLWHLQIFYGTFFSGATSGATDKGSGNIILANGISTGTGNSAIKIQRLSRTRTSAYFCRSTSRLASYRGPCAIVASKFI